jgi:hypothetical protein
VAVVDLTSGAERAALPVVRWFQARPFDLASDGRIVAMSRTGLATVRPGEPPSVLPDSRELSWPHLSGGAIAAVHDGAPVLVATDGSRTGLGAPTRVLSDFTADAGGVAWIANGCVRYAGLPAPAAPGVGCPSTEISLYYIADSRLRGRIVRTPVNCVAAPDGVCRGTVLAKRGGRVVGRGPFELSVGRERWVPIRLTRAAAARFRRERGGLLIIGARIPGGRVGVGSAGSSELTVKVR